MLIAYLWLPLSVIPIAAVLALALGVAGSARWDAVLVLLYSAAVIEGAIDFYRRLGRVDRAWWLTRTVGAGAGLVLLVALTSGS